MMSEEELTNPATLPNPQIKILMDLVAPLSRLAYITESNVAIEYDDAVRNVQQAIGHLMQVKNILAGEA